MQSVEQAAGGEPMVKSYGARKPVGYTPATSRINQRATSQIIKIKLRMNPPAAASSSMESENGLRGGFTVCLLFILLAGGLAPDPLRPLAM